MNVLDGACRESEAPAPRRYDSGEMKEPEFLGIPFVSDSQKLHTKAILKMYGQWTEYPLTGKRGTPGGGLAPPSDLRYAQVVDTSTWWPSGRSGTQGDLLAKTSPPATDTTSFVERCNLTMRQDNKRLARETLTFLRKVRNLDEQMTPYFTHFNLYWLHMSLKRDDVIWQIGQTHSIDVAGRDRPCLEPARIAHFSSS